ncbi:MAG: hypothetical protein FWE44_03250 [Defluviitaleaceae bacterium]|nr:hypothetical protein [Defluviitaleaceae bacterium]
MDMSKVQISKDFLEGVKHLLQELEGHPLDKTTRLLCKALQQELEAKYEALERRKTFSEYKTTTQGTKERENARQAYLNQKEIHKDWRTQTETHSPQ